MWNRNQFVSALKTTVVSGGLILCGCNTRGEDTVREKDFATSPTIKTAIGAAGSTFIAPIMNNWVTAYQQIHPSTLINYRPIGSGAGLTEFKQMLLSMAASDAPLKQLGGQQPCIFE